MAYLQDPSPNQIIDLTGLDDRYDKLEDLSSVALRAEEAASRLTSQFKSVAMQKQREYIEQLASLRPRTPIAVHDEVRQSPSISRNRRQAAVSASDSIAREYETLNPLEEELQASHITTPRKPGRPKKDEWTPTSSKSRGIGGSEERRRLWKDSHRSPTSGSYKGLIGDEHGKHAAAISRDTPLLSKKRKHSSLSLDLRSPSKSARTEGLQGQSPSLGDRLEAPNSSKEPSPKLVPDCQQVNTSLNAALASRIGSTEKWTPGDNPYESLGVRLRAVFEALIYPAIKKEQKRHTGQLTGDQLISLSKGVAARVTEKELIPLFTQNLSKPNDTQKKQIKRSIKKEFRKGATQILALPSKTSEGDIETPAVQTSARGPKEVPGDILESDKVPNPTRITDLRGYLSILESKTHESDSATHGHVASLMQDNSSTRPPRNSHPEQPSPIPYKSPPIIALPTTESALDQPFPPDFDRGRFPAQRRRRGNKYYTPPRQQKTFRYGATESFVSTTSKIEQKPASQMRSNLPHSAIPPEVKDMTDPYYNSQELIQSLVTRARSDRELKGLMEIVASGEASQPQLAVYQAYVDNLKVDLDSSERSFAKTSKVSGSQDQDVSWLFKKERNITSPELVPSQLQEDNSPDEISAMSRQYALNHRIVEGNPQENAWSFTSDTQGYPSLPTAQRSVETASSNSGKAMYKRSRCSPFIDDAYEYSNTRLSAASQEFQPQTGLTDLQQLVSSGVAPLAILMRQRAPVSRPLATALDPHLERLAAELAIDDSDTDGSYIKENWCFIDDHGQRQLVYNPTLLEHIDSSLKPHRSFTSAVARLANFTRVEGRVVDPAHRTQRSTASLLRHRELGSDSRGRHIDTHNELRLRNAEKLEPWRSWRGASGDIVTAAWASDSVTYAFGAAAHTNAEDLQYNRPCNLLLGELNSNVLIELPDHRVDRPKPESILSGPNAIQAVYDACDPMVYHTVTAVAFAPTGNLMYTASHDQTVKVWDTTSRICQGTLNHDAWVTGVEASTQKEGLFATATKKTHDSIRVYYSDNDSLSYTHFSSFRAEMRPDWQIYPECLRWGPNPFTSHLLLAGFEQWGEEGGGSGHLMLWDAHTMESIKVSPSSQSVFAAVWHPTSTLFATGGSPGNVLADRLSTKSVVRTWDLRSTKRYTIEYECPALDMQDVTFSPTDTNIITAGCTDGTSFVWDFRRPDEPLHRLRHGRPITDWDHTREREEADTGVMMSIWGLGGTLFYTGSSDGMIKAWDIRRHPADVLVRDVAQFEAGVQCGALSPDGTNLLVGDADGGIHILSSAPCGRTAANDDAELDGAEEPIHLVRAPEGSGFTVKRNDDDPGTEGRDAGRELVNSGVLKYDSEFGVSKGPKYHGPYARDSRKAGSEPTKVGKLLPNYDKLQAFSRHGEEREEIAQQRRGIIKARKSKIDNELSKLPEHPLSEAPSTIPSEDIITSSKSILPPPAIAPKPDLNLIHLPPQATITPYSTPHREIDHSTEPLLPPTEDNTIPETQMIEENFWWPRLGEDEIALAIEKARLGRG